MLGKWKHLFFSPFLSKFNLHAFHLAPVWRPHCQTQRQKPCRLEITGVRHLKQTCRSTSTSNGGRRRGRRGAAECSLSSESINEQLNDPSRITGFNKHHSHLHLGALKGSYISEVSFVAPAGLKIMWFVRSRCAAVDLWGCCSDDPSARLTSSAHRQTHRTLPSALYYNCIYVLCVEWTRMKPTHTPRFQMLLRTSWWMHFILMSWCL